MLRAAWFIARKDVQYLLWQKETILWTFIMPVIFFYFIGTITAGFGGSGPSADTLALRAPQDAGFLLDRIVKRLEDRDFRVVRPETEEEFLQYGRRLTIPPGMTDTVLAGETATVRFARRGGGMGSEFDQVRIGRALYTVLADLVVSLDEGETPGPEIFDRIEAAPRSLTLEVVPAGERPHIPTGFEQAIPGTMVMFTLLVLLTSGAVMIVAERRQGMLRRLAYTPIPRGAIVFGKWIGRMMLGTVQIVFAMLVGSLLFGMDWGPDLPMVVIVLFFWAGLNASLGLLLGNLARTEGQAVGIGVLSANVLAALGGCWWPIEITPAWMQKLALFLPTGWAMDALHRLISFGAGWTSVLPHVLIMILASLATGRLAARLFRFQ